jgi:hypothetical protein
VRKAEEARRKAEEEAAVTEREKQARAAKAVPASKVCRVSSEQQALLTMLQHRAQEVAEDSEGVTEVPLAKVSQFGGSP